MNIEEFESYISNLKIGRTVLFLQQHHTYKPSYIHFDGNNHFNLQKGMKQYHVTQNGWMDIGQHFTTFPDGAIVTGRNIEFSPACIYGNNANAVCVENVGNFDKGADIMSKSQKEAIIRMTAALCRKFNLAVDTNKIVYHHWFDLSNGQRNNGARNNKSCPGTNFFGGNKVEDCQKNFLPLVNSIVEANSFNLLSIPLLKYVCVTAEKLNIRKGAGASYSIISERSPVSQGATLRVFEEKNGWLKISSSDGHWVNGKFTKVVTRATVKANVLNVRTGPSTNFPKTNSLYKNQEVFVSEEKNGWCKVGLDDSWVSKRYLLF